MVVRSSLMASVNKVTVRKLSLKKNNEGALIKYAAIGKIFFRAKNKSEEYHTDFLLTLIEIRTKEMNIPGLAQAGITPADFEKIADGTDNKNNPVTLDRDEMLEILEMAG